MSESPRQTLGVFMTVSDRAEVERMAKLAGFLPSAGWVRSLLAAAGVTLAPLKIDRERKWEHGTLTGYSYCGVSRRGAPGRRCSACRSAMNRYQRDRRMMLRAQRDKNRSVL